MNITADASNAMLEGGSSAPFDAGAATAVRPQPDSTLAALAIIARPHHVAADSSALRHELDLGEAQLQLQSGLTTFHRAEVRHRPIKPREFEQALHRAQHLPLGLVCQAVSLSSHTDSAPRAFSAALYYAEFIVRHRLRPFFSCFMPSA